MSRSSLSSWLENHFVFNEAQRQKFHLSAWSSNDQAPMLSIFTLQFATTFFKAWIGLDALLLSREGGSVNEV